MLSVTVVQPHLCRFQRLVTFGNKILPDSQHLMLFFKRQVAQLSQRDHTAGWVSNGQKSKTGTERQYLRTIQVYIQPLRRIWPCKEIEIGDKTQNKGCYAV